MLEKELFQIVDSFTCEDSDLGKENANYVRSISVLEHLLVSEVAKEYLFKVIYQSLPIISRLHKLGFIYHHQTSKLSPYCIGLSSYDIALKGLGSNATNERHSSPPKRIDTLLSQCANLICLLSQEVSGATSVNDLSTVCAGYLFHLEKNLDQKIRQYDLENYWQSFLYNINLPFRAGNSPFSNITLDFGKSVPTLANKTVVYAGEYLDFCYKDIPSEYFDRINRAFIDAMAKGDKLGNPFTFPLITVNVDDNFDYDNDCWKYLQIQSEKFGGFYLQNYCTKPFDEEARKVNPYHTPYDLGMLYSNCCRMVFDIKELLGVTGCNPFASNSGVGGVGVITINLNRLLWLCQNDLDMIWELLNVLIKLCCEALELKRMWIRKNWTVLYPYLSYYVKDDKTLFSILSVCGMHEGLKSIGFEKGIYDSEGIKLAHQIAKFIRENLELMTKQYKSVFSLEYAPIETASVKLAQKDLEFSEFVLNNDVEVILNEMFKDITSNDELTRDFIEIIRDVLIKLKDSQH